MTVTVDIGGWRAAAADLRPVPDDVEDLRVGRAAARRALRCDDALLDELKASGLPSRSKMGEESFSYCDVMNVGLYSGSGRTVPELAERFITRFGTEPPPTWTEAREWRVTMTARCPLDGDCEDGSWRLPELDAVAAEVLEHSISGAELKVVWRAETLGASVSSGGLGPVDDLHRECLARFRDGRWRYQYLPVALRADPGRADANGAMDCFAVAAWLFDRAEELGIAARVRQGLLLAFAGVEHAWIEVEDADGRHRPVDPVLAFLVDRGGDAHPDWAAFTCGSRCNRVVGWRLADEDSIGHVCAGSERTPITTVSASAPKDGR